MLITWVGDYFIDENPHRKFMSDAWEYKEAIWSGVKQNPFRIKVDRKFNDRINENMLEIEQSHLSENLYIIQVDQDKKDEDWWGPREREVVTYYQIIGFEYTSYNKNRDKTRTPNIPYDNKGYTLDNNGYPIEYEEYIADFPKAPISLDDAREQLEKLYSDLYWDFSTWLGHHSREGWEIFKISRDFNSGSEGNLTRCVFRRRV